LLEALTRDTLYSLEGRPGEGFMKRFSAVTSLWALLWCAQGNAADLKAGDAAPEFSLRGSDGQRHKLSDFKGKRAVVLAWFPKAFTGG
jgi:peroxiredoxin Q/BCP